MEDFLFIPPYIWKGIFSIIKVIGAGLILAFFATKYQKRKEIELQIKANVLKLQLDAYVKINDMISEIRSIIAPPLVKETWYEDIIEAEKFGIKYMEYSSFFDSEEKFDAYYNQLVALNHREHIYLQYRVEQKLSEYISYLTELKTFLDAYSDTERCSVFGFQAETAEVHIQEAYRITGICMQSDMNRFYAEIDRMLATEIRHISLSYRSHYIKSLREWCLEKITIILEKYLDEKSWKGNIAMWFYYHVLFRSYGNSRLLQTLPVLVVYFSYIHYSDKYTPEQFYDEEHADEIEAFHRIFQSQLHHG